MGVNGPSSPDRHAATAPRPGIFDGHFTALSHGRQQYNLSNRITKGARQPHPTSASRGFPPGIEGRERPPQAVASQCTSACRHSADPRGEKGGAEESSHEDPRGFDDH